MVRHDAASVWCFFDLRSSIPEVPAVRLEKLPTYTGSPLALAHKSYLPTRAAPLALAHKSYLPTPVLGGGG